MKSIYSIYESNSNLNLNVSINNIKGDSNDISLFLKLLNDINLNENLNNINKTILINAFKTFLKNNSNILNAICKNAFIGIGLKIIEQTIYNELYKHLIKKDKEYEYNLLNKFNVKIKPYENGELLCIIKFNNTTISFLIEKK